MTIAMLNVDPPYAAVAADQLAVSELWDIRSPDERERSRVLHCKVNAHSTLPLVWVSAGMGVFAASNAPRTVDQAIVEACERPFDKPLNQAIVPRIVEVIHPLVLAELESGTYDDDGAADEPKLWILVGVADPKGAGGALLKFGRQADVRAMLTCILPSTHSTAYIESLPEGDRFPPRGSRPGEITGHMRRVLSKAIADAQRLAGDAADVGGAVDIAIATPHGAAVLKR
jgi:hypothetical protein